MIVGEFFFINVEISISFWNLCVPVKFLRYTKLSSTLFWITEWFCEMIEKLSWRRPTLTVVEARNLNLKKELDEANAIFFFFFHHFPSLGVVFQFSCLQQGLKQLLLQKWNRFWTLPSWCWSTQFLQLSKPMSSWTVRHWWFNQSVM